MRHPLLSVAIVAAFSCSATAYALTCHIVLDRADTVVYRDIVPPVDLSERGRAARTAMRQRGEFLLMIEADQCSRFVATTGAAGAGGATVDEIVAGLRSYQVTGSSAGVMSSGVMSSARPSAGPAAAPGAPPALPAPSGGRPY
ncbi:MAG TPA: hypothetical protein VHJ55_09180 [Casimicrobiaceae bacterium]|nr:hypothetical protein [Casimicrobiaceae bacterium]